MAHRDLRVALQSLSDQSIKTSRRLDDTYYSILEKVSTLRQTIGTLQELSDLTKELHNNFEADAQELIDDVQGQFDNSDNFDAQQKQVAALEERIRAGKKKADALTARLAKAKECVDARAKSEAQWEASTDRTLPQNGYCLAATKIVYRLVAVFWRHAHIRSLAHRDAGTLPPSQTHSCQHAPRTRTRYCHRVQDTKSTHTRHGKEGYFGTSNTSANHPATDTTRPFVCRSQ